MIAPGVSVAGVPVGGMTASQAQPWIKQRVLGQLTVTVGAQVVDGPDATQLGLHAYLARPLRVALAQGRTTAVTGQDIPVVTRITGSALRAFVHSLAPQVRIEPVDARFRLVKSVPMVVPDRLGPQARRRRRHRGDRGGPEAARPRPARAADEGRAARRDGARAAAGRSSSTARCIASRSTRSAASS